MLSYSSKIYFTVSNMFHIFNLKMRLLIIILFHPTTLTFIKIRGVGFCALYLIQYFLLSFKFSRYFGLNPIILLVIQYCYNIAMCGIRIIQTHTFLGRNHAIILAS